MRLAFTRATLNGKSVDRLALVSVITQIVSEVAEDTARIYGLVFNPNSPIYIDTINYLVETYASTVDSKKAREAVKQVLPRGLSLGQRQQRLNTFGLDQRAALSLERLYQAGASFGRIDSARRQALLTRGNVIGMTETNRAVNRSMLAVMKDNFPETLVEKAGKVQYIGTSRRLIMAAPHKTWLTRKDDKVCKYCEPLDGITARLDAVFVTQYGDFDSPPIHPNCRCFMTFGG